MTLLLFLFLKAMRIEARAPLVDTQMTRPFFFSFLFSFFLFSLSLALPLLGDSDAGRRRESQATPGTETGAVLQARG